MKSWIDSNVISINVFRKCREPNIATLNFIRIERYQHFHKWYETYKVFMLLNLEILLLVFNIVVFFFSDGRPTERLLQLQQYQARATTPQTVQIPQHVLNRHP